MRKGEGLQEFMGLVRITSGCWLWTGADNGHGYGQLYYEGKMARAHRVSWILNNGPIPGGAWVLHSCDSRRCVRPSHLFLGNNKTNMIDMAQKGRSCASITERTARLVLAELGPEPKYGLQQEIADRLNVPAHVVHDLKQRRTWAWLP